MPLSWSKVLTSGTFKRRCLDTFTILGACRYIDEILIHRVILSVALPGNSTLGKATSYLIPARSLMLVGIADLGLHIMLRTGQCLGYTRFALHKLISPLIKDGKFFCGSRIIIEDFHEVITSKLCGIVALAKEILWQGHPLFLRCRGRLLIIINRVK